MTLKSAIVPAVSALDIPKVELSAYYTEIESKPLAQVVSDGRRAMANRARVVHGSSSLPTGRDYCRSRPCWSGSTPGSSC